MRFFVGVDYKEPRAFGIYKEPNGNCVVYKNKADGSRAIRYQGADEAYAVNEIYQKMRAELLERKQADLDKGGGPDAESAGEKTGHQADDAAAQIKYAAGCRAFIPLYVVFD